MSRTRPDIDECMEGSHNCSVNAACTNGAGNYSCACNSGYSGNGYECTGGGWGRKGTFERTMLVLPNNMVQLASCEWTTADACMCSKSPSA